MGILAYKSLEKYSILSVEDDNSVTNKIFVEIGEKHISVRLGKQS